jgi:hypothetical protein
MHIGGKARLAVLIAVVVAELLFEGSVSRGAAAVASLAPDPPYALTEVHTFDQRLLRVTDEPFYHPAHNLTHALELLGAWEQRMKEYHKTYIASTPGSAHTDSMMLLAYRTRARDEVALTAPWYPPFIKRYMMLLRTRGGGHVSAIATPLLWSHIAEASYCRSIPSKILRWYPYALGVRLTEWILPWVPDLLKGPTIAIVRDTCWLVGMVLHSPFAVVFYWQKASLALGQ